MPTCRRCGRPITVQPALAGSVFEGMHGACFHLEFEHRGDPDAPCADPSCPVWRLEVYEAALRRAGLDPARVLGDAVRARYS